jgi:hypothetical protein
LGLREAAADERGILGLERRPFSKKAAVSIMFVIDITACCGTKLRRGNLSGAEPISDDAFFDAWTWPVDGANAPGFPSQTAEEVANGFD